MTIDIARAKARENAYQWRVPCWIVLDQLARELVVFCGPHEDYLDSEPKRFFPLEIHYPEGESQSKIGHDKPEASRGQDTGCPEDALHDASGHVAHPR
jgi:hypothetical protein